METINIKKKIKEKILVIEFIKFIIFSLLIVVLSKYLLVPALNNISKGMLLEARKAGNIAGIATSIPELLTVTFSAIAGLMSTSIYNILSSNIINLIQYIFAIFLNKNQKYLSNKVVRISLVIIIVTIIIPLFVLLLKIKLSFNLVIIFILLFILLWYINSNAHKIYMSKKEERYKQKDKKTIYTKEEIKKDIKLVLINIIYVILIGIALYVIGELLSQSLTKLSIQFNLPEWVLGILLRSNYKYTRINYIY